MNFISNNFIKNTFLPKEYLVGIGEGIVDYSYFITSTGKDFITSDGKNFRVRN